jgi:DNA modification methylase
VRNKIAIYTGDAVDKLRKLPAQSLNCCVTSPPYYGLRDYGTAKWEGGNPDCNHVKGTKARETSTLKNDGRSKPGSNNYERSVVVPFRDICGKCGATRIDRQLGLERTPEEYVARMVDVFREVRRVLRDDGTLWLNIGDSYATGAGKVGGCPGGGEQGERWAGRGMNTKQPKWAAALGPINQPNRMPLPGLKPKDLIGIPWMLAFALRADGWYLRSDIIWHKPNPMPESVQDRPTKAHEYLFLLSKSRKYYYDADAIAEPCTNGEYFHGGYDKPGVIRRTAHRNGRASGNKRKSWGTNETSERKNGAGVIEIMRGIPWEGRPTRNRRTVWTITPQPYKGAHFATFPPKLIEPCILAGSPPSGTVLDPFAGSGTTLQVARDLGRNAIGIELNPAYVVLAHERLASGKRLKAAA